MATVELPCTADGCDYKTPALAPDFAFRQMDSHRADRHPVAPVVNANPPANTPAAPRPEKVQRPCFDVDQTTEKWQYLNTRWTNYKTATQLTGESVTIQLLEACSENLRFSMFQSDSQINQKSEANILALMKTLSVKEENVMVSRMKLHGLHQEAGEPIRNFVARIKGQAELCRFEIACPRAECQHLIRYTSEIVRDIIVRNLYDQDIQREILGQQDQRMELEQLIKLIEAKETGKRTQADILGQTAAAALSTYKRDRKNERINRHKNSNNNDHNETAANDSTSQAKCGYCGETGHGRNNGPGRLTLQHRREKCPAFSSTCNTCSRKGHFTVMCRQPNQKKPPTATAGAAQHPPTNDTDEAGAVESFSSAFEEMCAVSEVHEPTPMIHCEPVTAVPPTTSDANVPSSSPNPQDNTAEPSVAASSPNPRDSSAEPSVAASSGDDTGLEAEAGLTSLTSTSPAISIDTQQYDRLKGWINRPPSSHPMVNLNAHVDPSDYEHFGYKFTSPPRSSTIPAVTNTGCQSSIIGLNVVYRLGYTENDLIPTKMRMKAIDQNTIAVQGAIILRLSGRDQYGHTFETVQICFVSAKIKHLYLSEHGCKQLGIIPETFPAVGAALPTAYSAATTDDSDSSRCSPDGKCSCIPRASPPPIPTELPFSPIEANRLKLENWLKDYYKASVFNNCPHQQIPLMAGPPVKIHIDPNAELPSVHRPIPVPLHFQDEVYEELLSDVKKGVIRPVAVGQKSTAISPMLIQTKKNGKPRRVVDYQELNKHCARETHHTMSPFHQATLVPAGMKKTVTDAWNGYHSVPIREEDRHLTTFISPYGRWEYCVLPQGLKAAGDAYTRRFDEIVKDFPNKTKCIDDTCMWETSIEKAFFQACQWIDLCGRNGIILNVDKFEFAKDIVEFAGFEITLTSIRPGKDFLRAIRDFPCPKNITDVRSFFGLINQVNYCLSSSAEMQPFRDLLSPSTKFYWDDHLSDCFNIAKEAIIQSVSEGVRIFDKKRKTCLSTDWCKQGIGFSLYQQHCKCVSDFPTCCPSGWKVMYISLDILWFLSSLFFIF